MEYQFIYQGKQIKVNINEAGTSDTLEVNEGKGTISIYSIESIYAHKRHMNVKVSYTELITNSLYEPIKFINNTSFSAVEQETFNYFYIPSRSGQQMDKMCINGLLTYLYGIPKDSTKQVMCFDSVGNFYSPIWFTYSLDEVTLTVEIESKLENEVYTYKLGNLPAQSVNTFDCSSLDSGEYTLYVTSPNSMPCIKTISI